jgi:hypothetical protein
MQGLLRLANEVGYLSPDLKASDGFVAAEKTRGLSPSFFSHRNWAWLFERKGAKVQRRKESPKVEAFKKHRGQSPRFGSGLFLGLCREF